MKFTVGQKLWFVPEYDSRHYGRARWVEVVKVGRAWLTLDPRGWHGDLDSLARNGRMLCRVDKNHTAGHVYESQKVHADWMEMAALWKKLSIIPHLPNPGVTVEDIHAAAKLLKINLE